MISRVDSVAVGVGGAGDGDFAIGLDEGSSRCRDRRGRTWWSRLFVSLRTEFADGVGDPGSGLGVALLLDDIQGVLPDTHVGGSGNDRVPAFMESIKTPSRLITSPTSPDSFACPLLKTALTLARSSFGLHGFPDIIISTDTQTQYRVALLALGCHHDDRNISDRRVEFEETAYFNPVKFTRQH